MTVAAIVEFLTSPAGMTIVGLVLSLLSLAAHASGNRLPLGVSTAIDWLLSFVKKQQQPTPGPNPLPGPLPLPVGPVNTGHPIVDALVNFFAAQLKLPATSAAVQDLVKANLGLTAAEVATKYPVV